MLLELETTTSTRIASGPVFKRSSTSPFASNPNLPMDVQINFLHGDAEPNHGAPVLWPPQLYKLAGNKNQWWDTINWAIDDEILQSQAVGSTC